MTSVIGDALSGHRGARLGFTLTLLLCQHGGVSAQPVTREIGVAVAEFTVTDFKTLRLATGNAEGSIFFRIHLRDHVFIEPELGFVSIRDTGNNLIGESNVVIINPALHVGRSFAARGESGWFAAAHVAAQFVGIDNIGENDAAHGDLGLGASAGHWWPLLDGHASFRLEARYRRWLSASSDRASVTAKVALTW